MPPEIDDEHVAAICRVLLDHGVQFVVIGGVAARLHETGHATVDVDVCPSIEEANLEKLSHALRDLGARLRVEGEPAGVPFDPHPDALRLLVRSICASGQRDSAAVTGPWWKGRS